MGNTVLVDTGFLVALFDGGDPLHAGAKEQLAELLRPREFRLTTVWPTVVETCFFLNAQGKRAFLKWIHRGALQLRHIEIIDIPQLLAVIDRYADQRIDLADVCLVWLAGKEYCHQILTTDRRDFAILRTPDGQPFERIWVKP